jgi:small-conductance mechanosensitive channel
MLQAAEPLSALSGEIDRGGLRLMRRLNWFGEPWMWGAAALAWALLVLLVGRLVEHGVARLHPGRVSWLGRLFRLFAYSICGLFNIYLLLQCVEEADLARPLLKAIAKLLPLAVAIGTADLALLLVNLAIERYLSRTGPDGNLIERSPRILTLLPLLRNIVMIALGAVLALVVLGEFGVNIAPLLAGAGVVGVAVGFGAQKLVQDLITGLSMLFENTIAVGDTVKIGEHVGTVESMTLRALRLRDAQGQLHTLPFNAVTSIVNASRDFGHYPFEVNIPYSGDVERSLSAIAAVLADMQGDPALAGDIVAPPELFGVERLGDWSVVLSGRIKTAPGRQIAVQRAFNARIKAKFAAEGLALAYRKDISG